MKFFKLILTLLLASVLNSFANQPIPYSGKIAIRGVNYFGDAQFTFSLQDKNGNTRWRNGKSKDESIKVNIRNGYYTVLLGGQGMNALPPQLFLDYDELYLKVHFDNGDGQGLRHLAPDKRINATPRALVAEVAKIAKIAQVAEKVGNGAITREMLSPLILNDLNATIEKSRLSTNILSDINRTITYDRLAPSAIHAISSTSLSSITDGKIKVVPFGQTPPSGYSLYHRGKAENLNWEFTKGNAHWSGANRSVLSSDRVISFSNMIKEKYLVDSSDWNNIKSIDSSYGHAAILHNEKVYIIGGSTNNVTINTVQVYDISSGILSVRKSLPMPIHWHSAKVVSDNLFVIGGHRAGGSQSTFRYNFTNDKWDEKSPLNVARNSFKLDIYEGRIWATGGISNGNALNSVESYDLTDDKWHIESRLSVAREFHSSWVYKNRLFVAGGRNGNQTIDSIECYDPNTKTWYEWGKLPYSFYYAAAFVVKDILYIFSGNGLEGTLKLDLTKSSSNLHDIYIQDLNTTIPLQAEVADGSVTASKIVNKTIGKDQISDDILKYLKPEITEQPNVSAIFSDTNFTFALSTEGKYLTYQWKKNDSDLVGETNATFTVKDANASQHDGNYSVVVTNDFGSVVSDIKPLNVLRSESDGLLAWYDFDGNSQDKSGNNRHGSTSGISYVNGKIMQAVNFDGNNDRITLPSFPIGGSNTFALWLYFENADDWNAPFDFGDGGQSFNLRLSIGPFDSSSNTYPVVFDIRNSQYENIVSNYFFSNSSWVHLTVVLSDTFNLIYKSGNLVHKEIGLTPITKSRTKQWIGKSNWNSDNYRGLIDDFRIYDRAISSAEVQALYNLGK